MQRSPRHLVVTVLFLFTIGAGLSWASQQRPAEQQSTTPQSVVIHITSGPDDIFSIMTALHLAEDARALGKRTIIMFSKAGARVPMVSTGWELRIGDEPPVRDILIDLQRRGVELIVCDFSARTLGIYDQEFLNGTFIANTNETLLRRMGTNAAVFTF
jgi:predicted peroxiredoxin